MKRLFGTDGVRGEANKELDPVLAYKLGKAACIFLNKKTKNPTFLIGKDTRISGDMLECALCAGIMSCGGNVLSAGVIPTPAVAALVRHFGADCGVVISASHNPFYDNGIKFFDSCGQKLSDETEDLIQEILGNDAEHEKCTGADLGQLTYIENADDIYVEEILSKLPEFDLKGMKVVLDCANGAAFKTSPKAFAALQADVTAINTHPDGININSDCGSTHTEMLKLETVKNNADFGLAFDGDADRLIACDENGNEVNGDMIMYLLAKELHARKELKDDTLVITVMSNLGLKLALEECGIKTVQTAVGDRYILQEMKQNEYSLGGEQSGHIIDLNVNSTGDGLATALMLSYLIKKSGKKLSELLKDFKTYPQILVNVKTTPENKLKYQENEKVAKALDELNVKYDGKGRVLLRHSGTEPLVRVMIEGLDTEEINADANYLAEIIAEISK